MKLPVLGCALLPFLVACPGGSRDPDEPRKLPGRALLDGLAECGVVLNAGVRPGEVLAEFDPARPLADQYLVLLAAMGSPLDREPHPFPSDSVFTLEPDSIEERGDYVFLARRLRTLARGKLPLTAVEDYVNLTKKKAWVKFKLGKRSYKWEARVQGGSVDQEILVKFADLLKRKNSEVRFLSVTLGGGVRVIGCATNREMQRLRDLGVPARWL